MKRHLVRLFLRLKLAFTSRASADALIRRETRHSLALLDGLSKPQLARPVRVPPLTGIDPDMRDWSAYQVLEHDAIVNRAFTTIILGLAHSRPLTGLGDPKRDVMPSAQPGPDIVEVFKDSVDRHFKVIAGVEKLRGTIRHPHPVCGPLDAHGWHAFFGIHLALHRAQLEVIRSQLTGARPPAVNSGQGETTR